MDIRQHIPIIQWGREKLQEKLENIWDQLKQKNNIPKCTGYSENSAQKERRKISNQ